VSLDPKQKKYLKGIGHSLSPVVTVADKGLTDNVMAAIEEALNAHELIKVKVRLQREARVDIYSEICEQTGAELITTIGMVLLIYRPTKKNLVELPGFKAPV
jgi:RNA-binding protein